MSPQPLFVRRVGALLNRSVLCLRRMTVLSVRSRLKSRGEGRPRLVLELPQGLSWFGVGLAVVSSNAPPHQFCRVDHSPDDLVRDWVIWDFLTEHGSDVGLGHVKGNPVGQDGFCRLKFDGAATGDFGHDPSRSRAAQLCGSQMNGHPALGEDLNTGYNSMDNVGSRMAVPGKAEIEAQLRAGSSPLLATSKVATYGDTHANNRNDQARFCHQIGLSAKGRLSQRISVNGTEGRA